MTFKFNEPTNIAGCYRIRILHKGNLTDKLIIYLWTNERTVVIERIKAVNFLNSHALGDLMLGYQILSTSLKRNVAYLIAFIRSSFDFRRWRRAIQARHFQSKSTFGFLPMRAESWLQDVNFDFVTISSLIPCADGTHCVCILTFTELCILICTISVKEYHTSVRCLQRSTILKRSVHRIKWYVSI
jgi:hypothetical protein